MDTNIDASVQDGLRFLQTTKGFLGKEFLTWLWFLSESKNHAIEIPGLGEFKFYIDDKIVLSSSSGSVRENSLKGGTPAYANEAHLALVSGKLVQEAKFILQDADQRQWMWSMKSDDLSLRSLRLPSLQEPDPATHIAHRLRLMQILNEFLDTLFKDYMAIRLTPQFERELDAIRLWADSKHRNEAFTTHRE